VYIQAVNTALIDLYWQIRAISRKIEAAEWGDGVVDRLAQFIERTELAYAASPAAICLE
jgi:hypothetical protein